MSIETFIDKFAFAIEIEPEMLSSETEYKTLEVWDSLNTLAVIAMADADFNVALSGQDIESSRTIGNLWQIVQGKAANA